MNIKKIAGLAKYLLRFKIKIKKKIINTSRKKNFLLYWITLIKMVTM